MTEERTVAYWETVTRERIGTTPSGEPQVIVRGGLKFRQIEIVRCAAEKDGWRCLNERTAPAGAPPFCPGPHRWG